MLSKPVYEALPYGYMALGCVSFMLLDPEYALMAAVIVFLLGARIYNLRSQNRRTDPVKRRKTGYMPTAIYDYLPFIYLFTALVIFKFFPKSLYPLLAILLLSYSFYILIRRSLYRRHKLPVSPQF
ncbi:hypothetical protein D0436_06855 [Shewanella decolorationis]|uniref:Uncharacterized protein n=1 Tax=Shewanella decolorationis TaxID=256839 RepID=A0A5B8QWB3_9GAMM|nr:hypothetical protein [Shewanella decolorationis]QDZ90206.1 hypothetical protein D0436_06855 [Shewanella decolorationis]